jgi:hypothetical protein
MSGAQIRELSTSVSLLLEPKLSDCFVQISRSGGVHSLTTDQSSSPTHKPEL